MVSSIPWSTPQVPQQLVLGGANARDLSLALQMGGKDPSSAFVCESQVMPQQTAGIWLGAGT